MVTSHRVRAKCAHWSSEVFVYFDFVHCHSMIGQHFKASSWCINKMLIAIASCYWFRGRSNVINGRNRINKILHEQFWWRNYDCAAQPLKCTQAKGNERPHIIWCSTYSVHSTIDVLGALKFVRFYEISSCECATMFKWWLWN